MQFTGAITALVTPFKNGQIDEEGFRNLIEWQIQEGIDGLVPMGTTGEKATLTHEEYERAVKICVDQVKKRVPVIAGAGSNNTVEAIELLKFVKNAGADAGMMLSPYYNKPTQEGVYQHFKAIGKAVPGFPMVIYNVPGRTGLNMLPKTVARMARDIPEVVAVKEACGNIEQIAEVMEYAPKGFTCLSGDDSMVLAAMALGAKGVISVASNIVPRQVHELCEACLKDDYVKARELFYWLSPINRACFYETNPGPVKTALGLMGKLDFSLRLPLVPMAENTEQALRDVLKNAKLI